MSEDGSAVLAGDAAHLLSPAGGFGMNGGVADAVSLGWRLAGELNGWFNIEGSCSSSLRTALLKQYEQERKGAWDRYNSFQSNAVAEGQEKGTRSMDAHELAVFGPSSRAPVVGHRATDCVLQCGRHLHEYLAATCKGYTLVIGGDADNEHREACASRFFEVAKETSVPVAFARELGSEDAFKHIYGNETTALVFRPDQVLAWKGSPADLFNSTRNFADL